MNRRDFFRPQQLTQAACQLLTTTDSPAGVDDIDTQLLRLSRRGMGTTFEVVFPLDAPQALAAGETVFELLDELEAQLTVYRDTSEISHINRHAAKAPVSIEPSLFDLLRRSAQWTALTHGAFDISTGALVEAWGFLRGPRRVPSENEFETAREHCGMAHVALNGARRSVRFDRPGLRLNLGSVGKGYALDRAAGLVRSKFSTNSMLLQGGFSSVYAGGSPAPTFPGWPIDVRHPWDPERKLARLHLRDEALGTSAATFQYLEHQGRKLGHVLDPRTGWPASGIASASVVAPTAAEADALSTAFFVAGLELAHDICAARPDLGAVLLLEGHPEPHLLGRCRHAR